MTMMALTMASTSTLRVRVLAACTFRAASASASVAATAGVVYVGNFALDCNFSGCAIFALFYYDSRSVGVEGGGKGGSTYKQQQQPLTLRIRPVGCAYAANGCS